MGFEASEAVGGMEGFLDGSVLFSLSFVSFSCTFSLEALLRACLGPNFGGKAMWELREEWGGQQNMKHLVPIPRRIHRHFLPFLNKKPMPNSTTLYLSKFNTNLV